MISIYKYRIDFLERQYITAPIIKPLKVDYQNGVPYLWAIIDTNQEPKEWVVSRAGTGWDLRDTLIDRHLDAFLNTTTSDPYIWHWFCYPLIESSDF